MQQAEKLSLEQIRAFLQASEEVQFEGGEREEIYGWISRTLQLHGYRQQPRANRGLLRRYLEKLTGLSRAQVTRLIRRYLASGESKRRATDGTGSRNAIRERMWNCWRRWTKRMKP